MIQKLYYFHVVLWAVLEVGRTLWRSRVSVWALNLLKVLMQLNKDGIGVSELLSLCRFAAKSPAQQKRTRASGFCSTERRRSVGTGRGIAHRYVCSCARMCRFYPLCSCLNWRRTPSRSRCRWRWARFLVGKQTQPSVKKWFVNGFARFIFRTVDWSTGSSGESIDTIRLSS